MKVAQINKPGANFELVERDIPEPGPGEVRIKVEACGIGSSSSFAKYLPVRGPRTVTTTHLSFCGARVISSSRFELPVVQRLLGHASLMTTAFYLHVTTRRLGEVHSPLDLISTSCVRQ
jgi:hypothetical protein